MKTKSIKVGNIKIGGGAPVSIQSMTNTNTSDILSTVKQIKELEKVGCEIVRVAVPDLKAAKSIGKIKEKINIPLVADIHFDYRLAIESIQQGCDKLRLNPGNIRDKTKIKQIADLANKNGIPIRIGVNSGSIDRSKYKKATPENLVRSALDYIKILEGFRFYNIVVSIKSTDVSTTIEAYRMMSKIRNYPLHLGITEAGTKLAGTIKNAIGIGVLLYEGIGDTIRVSITGNPVDEVIIAKKILSALGLRKFGIEIISCPTCARMQIDVERLATELEKRTSDINKNLKVTIMGCIVNGP